MLRIGVVGHRTARLLRRELQHQRTECSDHDRPIFRSGLAFANTVKIGTHRRHRLFVAMTAQPFHHRRMADAEAEDEALAIQRVQRQHAAAGGEGIARVDAGNGASELQLRGIGQHEPGHREGFEAAGFGIPQHVIAKSFHRGDELLDLLRTAKLVRRIPGAETSDLHDGLLMIAHVAGEAVPPLSPVIARRFAPKQSPA